MIRKFSMNKLIRDNAPVLSDDQVQVTQRTLGDDEYIAQLKLKLVEEAQEVLEAQNIEDTKTELADVMEVIHALCSIENYTLQEIEEARVKKKAERGGFEKRVYCQDFAMDESNPKIAYFLANSKKYREIK